jgi:hypothetical protein
MLRALTALPEEAKNTYRQQLPKCLTSTATPAKPGWLLFAIEGRARQMRGFSQSANPVPCSLVPSPCLRSCLIHRQSGQSSHPPPQPVARIERDAVIELAIKGSPIFSWPHLPIITLPWRTLANRRPACETVRYVPGSKCQACGRFIPPFIPLPPSDFSGNLHLNRT